MATRGQPTEFVISDEGEPHSRRRRELLRAHPELRQLFGNDPRTAWIVLALVFAQLGLAAFVPRLPLWGFLAVTYLVGAVFNHWLAMGIHEASHDLVLRGPRANRWLAMFANIPLLIPSAMSFRRYHLDHHTYLGIHGRDNDLPTRPEARIVGNSPLRKAFWLLSFLFIATLLRGFLKRPNRWEVLNMFTQALAVTAIGLALGRGGLGYLLLSTFFGMGLHPVAAHWIHEHYLFEKGQETYSYYGPLNRVNFNVGYHNEHHDLMWIPGRFLPLIRETAPEFYSGLRSHDSWIGIPWRFVFDRGMSHFSRMLRSYETFRRAQRVAA
jgi:sphingolipid delta-4 desaturase